MRDTKTTIIDFYQGAYGPAIRIDVQNIEWLKLFKKSLTQLISNNISELDLLSLSDVEKDEIRGFNIKICSSTDLVILSNEQSEIYHSFLWTINEEYMKRTIGAIDWFLKSNKAGHYYLYEGEIDIELAYKE
ncbi:MAG: hypothetical protein AAGU14_09485 [Eubacteriaceae bacterium]